MICGGGTEEKKEAGSAEGTAAAPAEGGSAVAAKNYSGKWVLKTNEGHDAFLSKLGIGFIKRKAFGAINVTMTITQKEGLANECEAGPLTLDISATGGRKGNYTPPFGKRFECKDLQQLDQVRIYGINEKGFITVTSWQKANEVDGKVPD